MFTLFSRERKKGTHSWNLQKNGNQRGYFNLKRVVCIKGAEDIIIIVSLGSSVNTIFGTDHCAKGNPPCH